MRNSLDIVKGLALGAKSMGVAGTILASLMSKNGLENTLALVQQWQEEVKMLYTLLGKDDRRIDEYRTCPRSSFS